MEIKPDEINIAWEEPEEPNGDIIGYTCNYTGTPTNSDQTDIYIHGLGPTLGQCSKIHLLNCTN